MGRDGAGCMRRAGVALVVALALGGCVAQETRRDAVEEINRAFRAEYETVLGTRGTRVVAAAHPVVFEAVRATLVQLGMTVRQESPGLGLITADSPAPRPLSPAEWERAAAADLPKARALLARHVGALANLFTFEPEGLSIVINANVLETPGGTEVSFAMRMREVDAPKSDMPRREYPPPTAVAIGIDKLWETLDRELRSRGAAPSRR